MQAFTIQGKVKKIDLGTGFYGIVTDKGKEYLPVNLSPSLQTDGLAVTLKVVAVEETMNMYMWGETVKIV